MWRIMQIKELVTHRGWRTGSEIDPQNSSDHTNAELNNCITYHYHSFKIFLSFKQPFLLNFLQNNCLYCFSAQFHNMNRCFFPVFFFRYTSKSRWQPSSDIVRIFFWHSPLSVWISNSAISSSGSRDFFCSHMLKQQDCCTAAWKWSSDFILGQYTIELMIYRSHLPNLAHCQLVLKNLPGTKTNQKRRNILNE